MQEIIATRLKISLGSLASAEPIEAGPVYSILLMPLAVHTNQEASYIFKILLPGSQVVTSSNRRAFVISLHVS